MPTSVNMALATAIPGAETGVVAGHEVLSDRQGVNPEVGAQKGHRQCDRSLI